MSVPYPAASPPDGAPAPFVVGTAHPTLRQHALRRYHLLSAQLELAQLDAETEASKATTDPALAETHRTKAAAHQTAAREHIEQAAALIEETGYHRRDKDLDELRGRLA